MSSQTLNNYFSCIEGLSRTVDHNPGATRALLHLIEQYKDEVAGDQSKDNFFKGEYAFYSGQYERALKHYLEAKNVQDFEFFCYRASAHVSHSLGNLEKAIKFAEKAKTIFPDDYPTLLLLKTLFEKTGRTCDADCIARHMHLLSPSITADEESKAPLLQTCETASKVNFGESTIKELASIFEPHAADQLFAEETLTSPHVTPSAHLLRSGVISPLKGTTYCLSKELPSQVASDGIEGSLQTFQCYQSALLEDYAQTWKARSSLPDNCLYVFQGWHQHHISMHEWSKISPESMPFWLSETLRKSSGGFYLRWNGKGIAINPGRHFITELHHQGLHVKDIDYVIATNDDPNSYEDIRKIYELSSQLSTASDSMQVVRYYLNPSVYQALSPALKSHSKQLHATIHCLKVSSDAHGIEKVDLETGVKLHYFRDQSHTLPRMLGIRLELSQPSKKINLGYISDMVWSPLLGQHLGQCDVLVAGFGNTSRADYMKSAYEDECLGYFGTYSLLEEISPRMLLCSDFGGREGDIRLEIVRKLRAEYALNQTATVKPSVILPADSGLFIDLMTLRVRCSTSSKMVDGADVRITNPSGAFGRLWYLAPECCL